MSQTHSPADGGRSAREVGIEREATELVESGWAVQASLADFDRPSTFAGHSPDIYATRKGSARIVVVDTDNVNTTTRHDALHDAAQARDADFYLVRVDDSGRRVEYTRTVE